MHNVSLVTSSEASDSEAERGGALQEIMSSNFVTSMFSTTDVEYDEDAELEAKRAQYEHVIHSTKTDTPSEGGDTSDASGAHVLAALEALVNGTAQLALDATYWRAFDASGSLSITEQSPLFLTPSTTPAIDGSSVGYFVCPPSEPVALSTSL